MSSPTQLSKKLMEERGYFVAIVEHWNAWARRRMDLFGIFDLLGVGEAGTLAVQTTSSSNVSARVRKMEDAEALGLVRKAGWSVEVHGWRKGTSGHTVRIVNLS